VCENVCEITQISKKHSAEFFGETAETVIEVPSTATDPFSTTSAAFSGENPIRNFHASPSREIFEIFPTSSMCPVTKCPEFRSPIFAERSRFTESPIFEFPKTVRRRDSSIISTVKFSSEDSKTVAHIPEIAIESPILNFSEKLCAIEKRFPSIREILPTDSTIPVNIALSVLIFAKFPS